MKKDTKKILQEALRSLPDHRDYSSVRYSIRKTITDITHLESKQNKKSATTTPAQQWSLNLEAGTMVSPFAAKQALKLVDQMISQEQKKLEELQKPKDPPQTQSQLFG
jgi:hypothetical protein